MREVGLKKEKLEGGSNINNIKELIIIIKNQSIMIRYLLDEDIIY